MRTPIPEDQIRGVYRDTIDVLYGYVSRRSGGDRALAEEVTQETWLRAVREWSRKGLPDKPIAWLTTVARNLLFNEFRRKQPVPLETVSAADVFKATDDGLASESAEIERRLQRLDVLHDAEVAKALHGMAKERLDSLRKLVEIGLAAPIDVKRAEVELLERAAELQAIARRLEMLKSPKK
jgi:DNA-directed RNA polymerase specialized sigma24 family protein